MEDLVFSKVLSLSSQSLVRVVHVCMIYVPGYLCHSTCVEVKDSIMELVPSFNLYTGSRVQTQSTGMCPCMKHLSPRGFASLNVYMI